MDSAQTEAELRHYIGAFPEYKQDVLRGLDISTASATERGLNDYAARLTVIKERLATPV